MAKAKGVATIRIEGKRAYVKTPYDADWVTMLHDAVPNTHREWRKEIRSWVVGAMYVEAVKEICRQMGWKIHVTTAIEDSEDTVPHPYAVLGLLPQAEDVVVKKAYAALANKHHPDVGGSNDRMREINVAYQQICKERGIP